MASALGVCACQVILGIDGHAPHAIGDDGGAIAADDGGGGPDTAAPPCVLPGSGDATLRVGNLVPSASQVDVCLARQGGASPIDGAPVLAGGSCAPLGYKDVTAPFKVASGTYDVALVAPGAGCGAPLATGRVTIDPSAAGAAYLFGDGKGPPQVLAVKESIPTALESKLRFAHVAAGFGALDLGLVDHARLPTTLHDQVFAAIAYGATSKGATSSFGSVDAEGYASAQLAGTAVPIGAALAGRTDATTVAAPVLNSGQSLTAFAIGRAGDVAYPPELYVCDEMLTDGPRTRCGSGSAIDVTIDVFDAWLWGPFATYEAQRHAAIPDAIAQLDSDVVCIPDVFPDSTADAIAAAASARFPTAIRFADVFSTPASDPRMQDGAVPPPWPSAPCAGYETRLAAFTDCARDHCGTRPADDTGTVIADAPATCISASCSAQAEAVLLNAHACWACAILQLESASTFADVKTTCDTVPDARFSFGGNSGLLMLSRYPLADDPQLDAGARGEQLVLPSTDWRASVVRAPLAVPNGPSFDAYCAFLTEPVSGVTRPYTGRYGNGQSGLAAWEEEQRWQVKQLVDWVHARSGGVPAVIGGEMYAGPAFGNVSAFEQPSYDALTAAFPLAAPGGAPPGCTLCSGNPILTAPDASSGTASTFTVYALVANVPVTDVRSASIVLQQNDVATDAGTTMIPMSPYYGFRTTVRVRP